MTIRHLIYTASILIGTCSCVSWHSSPPIGSVSAYAGNYESIPDGWMPCDGRILLKAEYDELSAILGGLHGANDTKFRMPDLRGRFIRGIDSSFIGSNPALRLTPSNNDPDRYTTRFVADINDMLSHSKNSIGSLQGDTLASHHHSTQLSAFCAGGNGATGDDFARAGCGGGPVDQNSSTTGGSETRPVNMALIYILRAR